MGAGDDIFTLNQRLNFLEIDWGNDPGDTFINNIGKFTFDARMLNFHWFDHIYTVGDDTLALTQLIDTGDVTIDNTSGITGVGWQVSTPLGGFAATTPANNLILNMLDNTGNNVFMDLANPVLAFLTLNLGDGDRDVEFIGASNNPLRDITITADKGNQNIELSVNAPLAVATLSIDLGEGFDMVDDDANDLKLGEDLIFRGVNLFENDGILRVARNAFVDTAFETEDTVFASNSFMFVAGRFTYTGGDGRDEVRLNGTAGTSLTGAVSIDVGGNVMPGDQQILLNHPSVFINNTLNIRSTNATTADFFRLNAGATVNGNIDIDLGGGDNTADILGEFGGSTVIYRGEGGVDDVTYGMTVMPGNLVAFLGDNDDTFTLQAGAVIAPGTLIVDFGFRQRHV